MKPQVTSLTNYVKHNKAAQNPASIFAHRYLSSDYQGSVLELQKKSEQPKQTTAPAQAAKAPPTYQQKGKENNQVLANTNTAPRYALQAKPALITDSKAAQKQTVLKKPALHTQNIKAEISNSIVGFVPACSKKGSCYNIPRIGGEKKRKYPLRCQHSARASVLGIDDSAQLERSRSSKPAGPTKIASARANSKKDESKKLVDQLMEGAKISQLKGKLKNITISLSKEDIKGFRQPLATSRHADPVESNTKPHSNKHGDRTEIRVIDLNLAQIQSESKDKGGNVVIEKLNALKDRIKSLLNVETRSVMLVRKKLGDLMANHK